MAKPDPINQAAWDVIEMLDLWGLRNKDALRYPRDHERRTFRQTCWITPIDGNFTSLGLVDGESLKAWSRDLTPSGMGFVTTRLIEPDEIIIHMQSEGGAEIRVRAAVRRRRKVHQDFWEHGVEFQEKVDIEATPAGQKSSASA